MTATRPEHLTYSASAEAAFRACQRKWWWAYRHGYRPVEQSEALVMGSAWHRLLEGYWREQPAIDPEHASDPQNAREAKLDAMLAAYRSVYPIDQRPQVVSIEGSFRLPLLDGDLQPVGSWPMVGAIDCVVQIDGELWIVESKTCSEDISPAADYWKRLPLDPQLSSYWLAARAIGYEVAGILYDVARKPDLKPYKATPPSARKFTKGKPCKNSACGGGEVTGGLCNVCGGTGWIEAPRLYADQREHDESMVEYRDRCLAAIMEEPAKHFRREPVRRLMSQVQQHMRTQASYARQMDGVIAAGYAPQNPSSCFLFKRACDYWAVCCAGPNVSPRDIPGAFTTREERGSHEVSDPLTAPVQVERETYEEEDWF